MLTLTIVDNYADPLRKIDMQLIANVNIIWLLAELDIFADDLFYASVSTIMLLNY